MQESGNGEESTEEGIGPKTGIVAIDGEFEGTVNANRCAILCRVICSRQRRRLRAVGHGGGESKESCVVVVDVY